jgi:hypothetical protein
MILGLILAVASALGTNLGFLFKQRGAVLARPIRLRHPVRSAADLFRSRCFLVGWIVSLVAWGLHVEALSLASLSSVQAVLSGGLVFLAVLAAILGGILVFGEPIGSGAVGIIARLLAFCLVIAGAALVPAPLRAGSVPGATTLMDDSRTRFSPAPGRESP